MSGKVVKRGKDTYTFRVEFPRVDGKRQQKTFTVKGTKKDAEREQKRIEHQVETGQFALPSTLTVGEYLDHWMELMVRPKKAANTVVLFESVIRSHLKPRLGAIRLHQLTEYQVQRYFADLRQNGKRGGGGLSETTLALHYALLRTALRQAIRWKFISQNPADIVDPPHADSPEAKALTVDQAHRLLETAADTPLFGPVLFGLCYGMRVGEITGLRWIDVETERAVVHVRQGLVWPNNQPIFTKPKSKRSRSYPLLEPVRLFLRGHKISVSPLIFPGPDGGPWKDDYVRVGYYALLEKAGLPRVRFHDLRHTNSAMLISAGIPLLVVSRWLGHHSATITANTYGHLMPGDLEQAGAAIERLFGVRKTTPAPTRKRVVVRKR